MNFALSSGLGLGAALGALLGFVAAGLAAGAAAVTAAWPAAAREARGAPDTAGAENGGEVMKMLKDWGILVEFEKLGECWWILCDFG